MPQNQIIVIAGPTASGKSALAIDVAKTINGIIINCDSMQVYKHMPIISACPSAEDTAQVEHRLFEIYEPDYRGNVVDWLNLAVAEIKDVWAQNKIPVVTGGTGLYIDNLINGTTPIPETKNIIRQKVSELLREKGCAEVYKQLREVDPETSERLNINDSTRICRAYEVWLDTGIKLSEWHRQPMIKKLPDAAFYIIKLCPNTAELDMRCYQRFDKMMTQGALAEVQNMLKKGLNPDLPAMKALGVPELVAYLSGQCALSEAVEAAKLHTRQFAKRQRTWFKNKLSADLELPMCYQGDFTVVQSALKQAKLI